MSIFKWGVSIFLSLCMIVGTLVFVNLLVVLAESYPTMLAAGVSVLGFLFLLWAGAQIVYIILFE